MKKNNIFYACAAAALVMISCQKEGIDGPKVTCVKGDLEAIEATSGDVQVKTLTQNGTSVLWADGDKIGLRPYVEGDTGPVGVCTYTTSLDTPSASATFVREESENNSPSLIDGKYVAVYPATPKLCTWSKASTKFVLLAAEFDQVADENGWDSSSSLMIASSENSAFSFKHMMSYIKFTVNADSTPFDKITVSPVNSSEEIISRLQINFDETFSFTFVENKSQCREYVTFTNSTGTDFAPGTYYIAINPKTYSEGLNFTFENSNGKTCIKTKSGEVALAAGEVADLGTVGTLRFGDLLKTVTVYEENSKKQGVVFWVDPANPFVGKAVSVCAGKLAFETTANATVGATDATDGLANYNAIVNSDRYIASPSSFPAVYYCAGLRETLGGNWRLPTISEMQILHDLYYGLGDHDFVNNTDYRTDASMTSKKAFDDALSLLGETEFATLDGDSDYDKVSDNAGFGTANGVTYMLGRENSDGKAQTARFGKYTNSSSARTTTNYVRCVRDVEVN